LKVNDENSRIRIQEPDPDPLVRGMDPRIRIHPKMSWIRNNDIFHEKIQLCVTFKSDQDPDSDPDLNPYWFGFLTEANADPQHWKKSIFWTQEK
jgi:hypothetical protein